jgi:hypothetical protein
MYREDLFVQELIFEQFNNVPPEPPPTQVPTDPSAAITGLTSNTLTVGGKVGTLQNIEAPQPIGPGASPRFAAVAPVDVTGTNTPGNHLDLIGGKGTGNGAPGQAAVRYPLIGASGSAVQSLSADRFPIVANLFTNVSFGSSIANTTTETSLIASVTGSAGATRTIEAGSARAGTTYPVRIEGIYGATGAPTGRIRFKLGSTLITDTTAFTVPAVGTGFFAIDFTIAVNAIGASGQVTIGVARAEFVPGLTGIVAPIVAYAGSFTTVNLTVNQTIDVTWEWGAANVANTITARTVKITRER